MNETEKRQLRLRAVAALYDAGISAETLATFLRVSRQTVHRWLGASDGGKTFFLPVLKVCERIDALVKLVDEIRKDWLQIVASWDGSAHRAVRATLLNPKVQRILESDEDEGEKAIRLTALTFNSWAADRRGRR